MYSVSSIIESLNEIAQSNMFLKDEQAIENLKTGIINTFDDLEKKQNYIETNINTAINQTFSNLENISKQRDALIQYLEDNISICKKCLNNLGEYY